MKTIIIGGAIALGLCVGWTMIQPGKTATEVEQVSEQAALEGKVQALQAMGQFERDLQRLDELERSQARDKAAAQVERERLEAYRQFFQQGTE